jgi:hypothetical protein
MLIQVALEAPPFVQITTVCGDGLSRGVVMPDPWDGNRPTCSDNSAKAHWCPPASPNDPQGPWRLPRARAARTAGLNVSVLQVRSEPVGSPPTR